jgi:hypothetical protein
MNDWPTGEVNNIMFNWDYTDWRKLYICYGAADEPSAVKATLDLSALLEVVLHKHIENNINPTSFK